MPNTKLLWVDSNKEANNSLNDDLSKSSLAYLFEKESSDLGYTQFQCMNKSDIAFVGIPNVDLKIKDELIIGSHRCTKDNIMDISTLMSRFFRSREGPSGKYWISFNANSLNSVEFKSTSTQQSDGLSVEFMMSFIEHFVPKSIGMDLSEVNFEMTQGVARHNDQQTFRELLEQICDQVNRPDFDFDVMYKSQSQKNI